MRIIRRLRSTLMIPALALLTLAGCFHTANPNELSCTQSKYCPDGYVCVGAQPGSPGKCQKPADAGRSDAISITDSADSTEDRANTDTWADGPVPPNDVPTMNTDTPAFIDQAPSPDISIEPDSTSDLPALADFGRDVPSDTPISPPDTSVDTTAPGPDQGVDQKPEGPDVAPDLTPTGCVIAGSTYASAATNPANACQVCKPATSLSGWSNADEGTSCGSGQYCNSGTCKAGCYISEAYYANGAANPANACQTCQTTYALTSWTASANGVGCGTGQVCSSGICQSGCWIGSALVGSGTTNSSNVCQICRPATSTSVWTSNTDGTSCGSGKTCAAGTCSCPAPTTDCGSSGCVNVNGNDSNHCGSCPNVCASNETCSSGACTCTLNAANACGDCLSWNFEGVSSPSPWLLDLVPSSSPTSFVNGAANLQIGHSQVHSGSASLATSVLIDFVNSNTAEVAVMPCKTGGTVDLAGYTLTAWVYIYGPAFGALDFLFVDTWGPSGLADNSPLAMGSSILTGSWFQVTGGLVSGLPVNRIGFRLSPATNWNGTIYIDDVVITGL